MILRIFALYDLKSGSHGTPFFMHHVGEAVRACIDLGQNMDTTVGRHPADFALHELGQFDTDTGLVTGQQPLSHGSVVSFLPRQPQVGLFDAAPGGERLSRNGMEPNARLNGANVVEA